MKKHLILFFIFTYHFSLYAIEIDNNSSKISILDKSSIFLDKGKKFTLEDIKRKKFIKNNESQLNFGLIPNTNIWIHFKLHNRSNQAVKMVLEYQSTEVESLSLYQKDKEIKRGLYHIPKKDKTIHPHFSIQLSPNEKRDIYIKIESKMRAISAKMTLWNKEDFLKEDFHLKMALLLFFAIMLTLFIYNLMLWHFTQDRVYMFYILYLLGISSFEANYYGLYSLYLFSPELTLFFEKGITIILVIMGIFFILFAREFLQLKKFKKIDTILKFYLYAMPISSLLAYDNQFFNTNIIIFYTSASPFLIYSGIFALKQGIKEAKYYLIGWTPILLSMLIIILQFIGIFDVKNAFPYILEFAFVSESFIFSIALAHRIEIAKKEKRLADKKLINFQKYEKEKLQKLVKEKTKELSILLEEKEILYKELNHRIKNNFMMILSLLKLQTKRTKNSETVASLTITRNRIESIAKLYEMLLLNNNAINLDTKLYLQSICSNIAMNVPQEITISYNIQHNLETNNLVYIGLIVNELVTNSFKYAFEENQGAIDISIVKRKQIAFLRVKDNGKGFKTRRKNSLGLTIVQILVEGQLQGELKIDSSQGTDTQIIWKEN